MRAVPQVLAWPERKVNLFAASTASLVQKEKLAMTQVCLKYMYLYTAHLSSKALTKGINNFQLFVRFNRLYQLSRGFLVQHPAGSMCPQKQGISFLCGTPGNLLYNCIIIWSTFMHHCFGNLHPASDHASG